MELHQETLIKIAGEAGIAENYINAQGAVTSVPATTLVQLLGELGYDTAGEEQLIASAAKIGKKDTLDPVVVVKQNQKIEIELNLGATARVNDFEWRLTTEGGESFSGYLQSQIVRDDRAEGGPLVFAIPAELPLGYHTLALQRKRRKNPYLATIIVTPESCYKQPELQSGKKLWGPSIQLYTLRSEQNWGIGDFSDLKQLVEQMATCGADYIGLNPIHALFPANPESASPYSPSSRRWLNTLYIDVSAVAEFSDCVRAQTIVNSSQFQEKMSRAKADEWVNYSLVSELKMQVLPLLFSEFKNKHLEQPTERGEAFSAFVTQGGESLRAQATFDALHLHLQSEDKQIWGWQVFPEEYRRFDLPAVEQFISENSDQVGMQLYLQWLADSQLNEVQSLAKEKGMVLGLYRDLAVGVSDSGSEIWSDDGSLLQNVSIGAPPDILGPLGQNWGLPPLNPQTLREKAYRPFIQLLKANMKHCGALRIDHVLGLLRLWWIPKGDKATEGAYMYYPVNDLFAILALESHRNQCSVIGEDLGTVPDEIVSLLADAGVHSYKVFFFETAEDGGSVSPAHYSAQSMSTLCTHDMPTLRGFWHCDDLKMGAEIGLYPDPEQLQSLFDSRLKAKQEIINSVAWHGYLPDGVGLDASLVPMDRYLSAALHYHLAAGSSSLMSLQLEDLLEMDKPVNIPGTTDQYPNWRRKLSRTVGELFTNEGTIQMLKHITDLRNA